MKRLLTLAAVVLVLAIASPASRGLADAEDAVRNYRLDVQGTPGVQFRLLLIIKPTERAGPRRREQIITIPAQIDFEAARCYAWIDTLPDGASGNDGDLWNITLLRDGRPYSQVEGTIRKSNRQSGGLGDL